MSIRSVLYVVAFSFPGTTGTPLHAMGMAEAMRAMGVSVKVAQLRPWPLLSTEVNNWKGIPVHRLARPGWSWRLFRLLQSTRPDIVHAHHIGAAVFSLWPSRMLGIPLVYERHSFWKEELALAGRRLSPTQQYMMFMEKTVLRKCDHIIALSQKMRDVMVAEGDIDDCKVSVVYPGVRSDWIHGKRVNAATIPGVEPDDFVVMYSGNFAPYQGVDLLLGAVQSVLDRIPRLKVVLVGATSGEIAAKKSEWPELTGSVIYLERRPHEEMPAFFARANVLVIPRPNSPICWTMPRKFGEYLSAGRPLLVTDVGDHRRVIDHFHCGVVTDSSVEGLARGLVELASVRDEERHIMGWNALRAAREWFDWRSQMEQILHLYGRLKG